MASDWHMGGSLELLVRARAVECPPGHHRSHLGRRAGRTHECGQRVAHLRGGQDDGGRGAFRREVLRGLNLHEALPSVRGSVVGSGIGNRLAEERWSAGRVDGAAEATVDDFPLPSRPLYGTQRARQCRSLGG
jgi:hypothetical protein